MTRSNRSNGHDAANAFYGGGGGGLATNGSGYPHPHATSKMMMDSTARDGEEDEAAHLLNDDDDASALELGGDASDGGGLLAGYETRELLGAQPDYDIDDAEEEAKILSQQHRQHRRETQRSEEEEGDHHGHGLDDDDGEEEAKQTARVMREEEDPDEDGPLMGHGTGYPTREISVSSGNHSTNSTTTATHAMTSGLLATNHGMRAMMSSMHVPGGRSHSSSSSSGGGASSYKSSAMTAHGSSRVLMRPRVSAMGGSRNHHHDDLNPSRLHLMRHDMLASTLHSKKRGHSALDVALSQESIDLLDGHMNTSHASGGGGGQQQQQQQQRISESGGESQEHHHQHQHHRPSQRRLEEDNMFFHQENPEEYDDLEDNDEEEMESMTGVKSRGHRVTLPSLPMTAAAYSLGRSRDGDARVHSKHVEDVKTLSITRGGDQESERGEQSKSQQQPPQEGEEDDDDDDNDDDDDEDEDKEDLLAPSRQTRSFSMPAAVRRDEGVRIGGSSGYKTSGRRKINIEFIEDKNRRHITFSKRKAGIMKKAFELSTLTGTQVLLLVASETGHVYTFATPKLQPLITKPEGKTLIQMCLNSLDMNEVSSLSSSSTTMAATSVTAAGGGLEPLPIEKRSAAGTLPATMSQRKASLPYVGGPAGHATSQQKQQHQQQHQQHQHASRLSLPLHAYREPELWRPAYSRSMDANAATVVDAAAYATIVENANALASGGAHVVHLSNGGSGSGSGGGGGLNPSKMMMPPDMNALFARGGGDGNGMYSNVVPSSPYVSSTMAHGGGGFSGHVTSTYPMPSYASYGAYPGHSHASAGGGNMMMSHDAATTGTSSYGWEGGGGGGGGAPSMLPRHLPDSVHGGMAPAKLRK